MGHCEIDQRWQQTLANSPIGISRVSMEGNFLEVNPALCNMLGYTERELTPLTWQDITYPDDLEADQLQVDRILDGEIVSYQMEKRYIRKDGQIVYAMLAVSAFHDKHGRFEYFISQIQDVSHQKALEQALQERVRELEVTVATDPLTGLYNRRYFIESALPVHIERFRRTGEPFSLLFIDLDSFKLVNDRYGHLAGDYVLKQVAGRIQGAVRIVDTCARLGGDEFAVLLEGVDLVEAVNVAYRLMEAVAEPLFYEGRIITPTCSVGWSEIEKDKSADQLLGEADQRMYLNKEMSRARAC